jgi:putative ABC transport system ATP-binding protein
VAVYDFVGARAARDRSTGGSWSPNTTKHHAYNCAVALANAWKVYGDGDSKTIVLRDLSLRIQASELTTIMGRSGSGKSTLMHCLAGLDTLSQGEAWLGRTCISKLGRGQLTRVRRERIGFIFQAFNLIPTLTAQENIVLPMKIAGRPVDRERFEMIVDRLDLRTRLRHRPSELSGGQQQRVACARALMSRPDVIFADEPTGNLDARTGSEVLSLLRDCVTQWGQTVVMVTHDVGSVPYSDRVLVLADGRIAGDMRSPDYRRVSACLASLEPVMAPRPVGHVDHRQANRPTGYIGRHHAS